jgi:hypothetical protein
MLKAFLTDMLRGDLLGNAGAEGIEEGRGAYTPTP